MAATHSYHMTETDRLLCTWDLAKGEKVCDLANIYDRSHTTISRLKRRITDCKEEQRRALAHRSYHPPTTLPIPLLNGPQIPAPTEPDNPLPTEPQIRLIGGIPIANLDPELNPEAQEWNEAENSQDPGFREAFGHSGIFRAVRPGYFIKTAPPKISEYYEKIILFETICNRAISCRALVTLLKNKYKVNISKSTISNFRRKIGLKCMWAKKRNKLTPEKILNRCKWCRRIQKVGLLEKNWVFSDESMFILNPTRQKIWQFPGENSDAVYQEYRGYPIKVMVWGAIGLGWKSEFIRVQGSQTAQSYTNMLHQNGIIPILDVQYQPGNYVWMQDGASCHTAKVSIEFLEYQNVHLLTGKQRWPPSSPDLNPIEQFWPRTSGA
jgi:transposase